MNGRPRKHIPARKTIYNGIEMRSRLEARFAAALDELGVRWEYEPNAFASSSGQYLPDFKIPTDDDWNTYIEVKPYLSMDQPGDRTDPLDIFRQMHVIHQSDDRARLAIAAPTLSPYLLMEWSEPTPLTWLDRENPLETDEGRSVIIEQAGLAAWFDVGDSAPYLLPLAGTSGDLWTAELVASGAGPLPFDWKWRR